MTYFMVFVAYLVAGWIVEQTLGYDDEEPEWRMLAVLSWPVFLCIYIWVRLVSGDDSQDK